MAGVGALAAPSSCGVRAANAGVSTPATPSRWALLACRHWDAMSSGWGWHVSRPQQSWSMRRDGWGLDPSHPIGLITRASPENPESRPWRRFLRGRTGIRRRWRLGFHRIVSRQTKVDQPRDGPPQSVAGGVALDARLRHQSARGLERAEPVALRRAGRRSDVDLLLPTRPQLIANRQRQF